MQQSMLRRILYKLKLTNSVRIAVYHLLSNTVNDQTSQVTRKFVIYNLAKVIKLTNKIRRQFPSDLSFAVANGNQALGGLFDTNNMIFIISPKRYSYCIIL